MKRADGRRFDELRTVQLEPNFAPNAEGSVLISMGDTRVLCVATVEDSVPKWMQREEKKGGWITGEYAMLPRSTSTRVRRERNGIKGRTQEIQRLIGRSLRAAVDLEKIGSRTITIDCDVIQADGGTRTAAITGGYIALMLALAEEIRSGAIPQDALQPPVAAISAGLINNVAHLDLCYTEDVAADVDANFVFNANGEIIEVQGTAEGQAMKKEEFDTLFCLAEKGIQELLQYQKDIFSQAELPIG